MSQYSPPSAGAGPSSSPYTGTVTDPTVYSPELARGSRANAQHRRDTDRIVTSSSVVASGKQVLREILNKKTGTRKLLPPPATYVEGAFSNEVADDSNDFVSRYILINQLPDGTIGGTNNDHEFRQVQHQMKLYACFAHCVPYSKDVAIHLRFDALRDASEAKDILEQVGFIVQYVTGYHFAIAKGQDTGTVDEFEGQIRLSIMFQPILPDHDWELSGAELNNVTYAVERICANFGAVRVCAHIETDDVNHLLTFRVEFQSIDAAHRAIMSLRAEPFSGINTEKTFKWRTTLPGPWFGDRAKSSPHRNNPRIDDKGRIFGFRPAEIPTSRHGTRNHPHDQHNRVRRERILDGTDVRTTVMLRNIPNKMDWMTLKLILNDVCFGTFDFMYLRIDFSNGNNVGYAFVNFADIHGMVALIDVLEGRRWIGFNSEKAAEISYATIQGKEALIQKFRNSSVMQETPFCRPRLYVSHIDADVSGGPRSIGVEQSMPHPDNLSKLQRSMDSARTTGLFPPQNNNPTARGFSGPAGAWRNMMPASSYDRGSPREFQEQQYWATRAYGPGPFLLDNYPRLIEALTDDEKNQIESWFNVVYGPMMASTRMTYFAAIPPQFIVHFVGAFLPRLQHFLANGGGVYGGGPRHGAISRPSITHGREHHGYDSATGYSGF